MARQKTKSVTSSLELRAEIARYDRMGFSQVEIAKRLTTKVSPARVNQIIQEQRKEYGRVEQRDATAGIEEKCQQLRDISAEAFAAWERSKEDATETVEEKALRQQFREINGRKVPKGTRMQVVKTLNKTMGRLPLNQYLGTIQACIEMECKLRGWTDDRPVNINQMSLDWDALTKKPEIVVDPLQQALNLLEDKSDGDVVQPQGTRKVGVDGNAGQPTAADNPPGFSVHDETHSHAGTNGTTNGTGN